jgi:hypothetical protein
LEGTSTLSKKPQSRTAEGHKRATASREQLLNDIRSIRKSFPNAVITRDFYRQQGKFADKAISLYFPKFSDLVKEAGCEAADLTPEPKAPTPIEPKLTPELKLDLEKEKIKAKQEDAKGQLKVAATRIIKLEKELEAAVSLGQYTPQVTILAPRTPSSTSESVACVVASDWHLEEEVINTHVAGLNEFNLEIGAARVARFWQGALRLIDILKRDTAIKQVIIALLGDFITNNIHEDAAASNLLLPMEAIQHAEDQLVSGLKFMLENTDPDTRFLIPCHSGNHARTTKKRMITTEAGNSLEYWMYHHLRRYFDGEKRIQWQIGEGYHTFTRLFDDSYVIRWHHGHAIRYSGGIGGITIPANRAIANWNQAVRDVNLDVFGHYHQYINTGNFICNGSLIGYNDFAVSIKASFEPPTQAFFLVNKRWNAKTMSTPIFLEE